MIPVITMNIQLVENLHRLINETDNVLRKP